MQEDEAQLLAGFPAENWNVIKMQFSLQCISNIQISVFPWKMFAVELTTPPTAHLTVFLHIQFPLIAQEVVWGFSPALPPAIDVPCPILLPHPLTLYLPACSGTPWCPGARLTAHILFELPHPCACPAPWMKAELCWMLGILHMGDAEMQ